MADPSVPFPEALLANLSWIQSLSSWLVADEASADDLVQDACLAALGSPPRRPGSPRGWLGTVMRNKAHRRHRSDIRRRRREEAVARSEAVASASDVAERVELQRLVVSTVLDLDEPYRSTVLLRYFDEHSTAEIARLQGVPEATVRSRLGRAHARLAEMLDGRFDGGREAWRGALIALVIPSRGAVAGSSAASATVAGFTIGGIFMSVQKLTAAAVVLILVLFIASFFVPSGLGDAPGPDPVGAVFNEEGKEVEIVDHRGVPMEARERNATPGRDGSLPGSKNQAASVLMAGEDDPTTTDERDAPLTIDGLVCDTLGRPLAGVAIVLASRFRYVDPALNSPDVPVAVSDHGGRFEFESDLYRSHVLEVADEDLVSVRRSSINDETGRTDALLIVAPGRTVSGMAVGSNGERLEGADIRITAPIHALARFPLDLRHTETPYRFADCAGDGTFSVERVPAMAGLEISAHQTGYESVSRTLAAHEDSDIRLELQPSAVSYVVTGRVVHADDGPAEGAHVALGQGSTVTDGEGRFELSVQWVSPEMQLVAAKYGLQPATLEGFGQRLLDDPQSSPSVELRLGAKTLEISGRVVDSDGKPLGGWHVVEVGTPLGKNMLGTIENLRWEHSHVPTATRDDGRFVVFSLVDRDYTLVAFEASSLRTVRSALIAAGTSDARIEVPEPDRGEVVGGTVLCQRGLPLVGVTVFVDRGIFDHHRGEPVDTIRTLSSEPITTTTGPAGDFTFDTVAPCEGLFFVVAGRDVVAQAVKPESSDDLTRLCLVVSAQVHFRYQDSGPNPGDSLQARDGEGRPLALSLVDDANQMELPKYRVRLQDGASPLLGVNETVTTILVFRGEEMIHEISVPLAFGRENRVVPR